MAVVDLELQHKIWQSSSFSDNIAFEKLDSDPDGYTGYFDISDLVLNGIQEKPGGDGDTLTFTMPLNFNIDLFDYKIVLTKPSFISTKTGGVLASSNNTVAFTSDIDSNTDKSFVAGGKAKVAGNVSGTATFSTVAVDIPLNSTAKKEGGLDYFTTRGRYYKKNTKGLSKSKTYYYSEVKEKSFADTIIKTKPIKGIGINMSFSNKTKVIITIWASTTSSKGVCNKVSTVSTIDYRGFSAGLIGGATAAYGPVVLKAGANSRLYVKPKEEI